MMIDRDRIGAILRRRRIAQHELADLIGVHQNTLSIWLNGKRDMPSSALLGIADALGVSVGYILRKGQLS